MSFDIDLTIRTGDEYETHATLLDPAVITQLQQLGYIVGTCSDREPSDQRITLRVLGQEPDFCIPKEMLAWTKALLPGQQHRHVGDDRQRDRDVAQQAGWAHQWPDQFGARRLKTPSNSPLRCSAYFPARRAKRPGAPLTRKLALLPREPETRPARHRQQIQAKPSHSTRHFGAELQPVEETP